MDDISPEFYKVTKRYLVRVCKAWYYYASPFLFEYVFLGKGRVLAPLRDGLLRSEYAVELKELPHTIGWQIQRLDVHMRDRTDDRGLIMDILADILRRLPNLRILTFAVIGHGYNTHNSYYIPENVLQATSACRDTLKFLNWYGGVRPSSDGPSWASFLENHPRLEAINAPVALTQLGNSHIVLDSLKSVYVHCSTHLPTFHVENELWNINLPNIRHAIYDITWTNADHTFTSHHNFLTKIGPNLTSIQINYLRSCPVGDIVSLAFYRLFQMIVANCAKLARANVVIYEWKIPIFFIFRKTVHTLGIKVNTYQVSKRSVVTFFRTVYDFLCRHPSLKTVCFTDQGNIQALRAHPHALSSGLALMTILDVNVMDHEGCPFKVYGTNPR